MAADSLAVGAHEHGEQALETEVRSRPLVLDVAASGRARDCQQLVSIDPSRSFASHHGASSRRLF